MRLIDSGVEFDFVAANATGGMVPGYELRGKFQELTGKRIPYVYVRGSRKPGGHKELVTGISNNPFIGEGERALVVEELVNFAQSTTNSAVGLREIGYQVHSAATILHYENPIALQKLRENDISVIKLTSLPVLLSVAEEGGFFDGRAIDDYKNYLRDPLAWQEQRGYEPVKI